MKNQTDTASVEMLLSEIRQLQEENRELSLMLSLSMVTLSSSRKGDIDTAVNATEAGEQECAIMSADGNSRILFERMDLGMIFIASDLTIKNCNRFFADLLNLPQEAIVGNRFDSYVASKDVSLLHDLVRKSRDKPARGELNFPANGVAPLTLALSVSSGRSSDEGDLCIIATDISDRIRSEEALRAASNLLEEKVKELTADLDRANDMLKTEAAGRERALRELAEEESMLRYILDSLPVGVLVVDDRCGIRFMNGRASMLRQDEMTIRGPVFHGEASGREEDDADGGREHVSPGIAHRRSGPQQRDADTAHRRFAGDRHDVRPAHKG